MDDEALGWAVRLDGGDLSPAELAVLNAWLAANPAHPWRLAHYQQFYARLHGTLPAMAAAGALAVDEVPVAWWRQRRWLRGSLAAGAAVAALALGAWWWSLRPQDFVTEAGQRESVTLRDGSRVDLSGCTRLAVTLRAGTRRVRLEQGEAVFSVAKDRGRPFFVDTTAGTVRVTGTMFDVRAVAGRALEVTVLEGTVAVQPVDAKGKELPAPRPLVAGDQLTFDPATDELRLTRPASAEDAVAWREGKVIFADTPLARALERFAEYHGRRIAAAPEIAALPLGGRYTLDDLDDFLASLEQALPVRAIRQDDGGVLVIAATRQR